MVLWEQTNQSRVIFTVLNIICLIEPLSTADLPQLVDYELESINEEVGGFWTGPVGPDAGNYSLETKLNSNNVKGKLCTSLVAIEY